MQKYVSSLSPSLRKIGKEAIAEIQTKFSVLEESVNSKKDALIEVLAKKYADNITSIDARIAELKTQNSGWVNQALNTLKTSVFAVIIEIKNTLAGLLSGVIDAIQAIITDPIGFFRNLIAGVSQGFANFGANIWTHLKTGFFGWLTGAMKGVSLTMPEDVFSLQGIFSITSQVLGLTWGGIRAIGARVIGEPVMKILETASEKGLEVVQVVRKDGAAGLWEYLKDQFADLKTTVMDAIMDIIQSQVIQAGIKWVMGLLTPVGAFIKAAMAIIDVVKFFIQRAAQIMELVKAFTDSIKAIASGNVGAVAKAIENALGRAIPVVIGFLASLAGLGGLADKVVGVIQKIRQRIKNAIVKFWNFVKGKAGKLLSKIGVNGKKKKDIKTTDQRTSAEKEHDLDVGVKEGTRLLKDENLDKKEIQKRLEVLEDHYNLQELKIVTDKVEKDEEVLYIYGKVNPEKKGEKVKKKKKKHSEYTPKDIEIRVVGDHKIAVTYEYDKEAHENGKQNFTVTIDLNSVDGRKVTQTVDGNNLALKPEGKDRGYHVSAGQLAREKYGLDLDSAHILADQFLGSGYKSALNLLVTSGPFNKQTMKKAEDSIKDKIKTIQNDNQTKIVTFDMTVAAIFEVLPDDKLIGTLQQAKPELNNDDKALQATLKKLNEKQDPRRCEKVTYEAYMFINGKREGRPLQAETANADTWLNDLFKK